MTGDAPPENLHLFAAVAGGVIWAACAAMGGRIEAWDTDVYWRLGLPAAWLAAGIAGFVAPQKPWRWALWVFGGQMAVLLVLSLLDGASFGLLPLGVLMFGVLSLPGMLAARGGARLRRRRNMTLGL